ncbi:MAG: hypothetical protein ACYCT2_09800 [Thermoplasmataceae archaeon]
MNEKAFYSIVIAIVVIGGIGVGIAYNHQGPTPVSTGAYNLNLVVIPGLYFNHTITSQPAYFVLVNGTLQSSANITIPSHRLIDLTIFDYDSGPGYGTPTVYTNVSGTIGGVVYILNQTMINATNSGTGSINIVSNSIPVKNISEADIAHTFTVSNLFGTGNDLNVPVGTQMVEFAQFYANVTGNYSWTCNVPCGSGPGSLGGAMVTPGWMMGTFIVS